MKNRPLTWYVFILALNMPPVNASEIPEQPESAPQAEVTKSLTPPSETYLAIIAGRAEVGDSDVTATYDCIFCTPVTVSKSVAFENGDTEGLRFGQWGSGGYEYAGISAELTKTSAHSRQVEAEYYALSVMP